MDVAPFGKNTMIVNGTPADISKGQEQEILEGILENFKQNEQDLKLEKRENLARSLAKNAGIQYGTVLAFEESEQLIQDLFRCEHPGYTPAGKPTYTQMDSSRLSDLFE